MNHDEPTASDDSVPDTITITIEIPEIIIPRWSDRPKKTEGESKDKPTLPAEAP